MDETEKSQGNRTGVVLILLAVVLVTGLLYQNGIEITGSASQHFWLEIIGFVIAILAGLAALKQARVTQSSFYLLISAAFLASGSIDLINAFSSIDFFGQPFMGQAEFIPAAWTLGRILISFLFFVNIFSKPKWVSKKNAHGLILIFLGPVLVVALAFLTLLLLYPIPSLSMPENSQYLQRPFEYLAFAFLSVATFTYFKIVKARGVVGTLLMASLITAMGANLYAASSTAVFDSNFNIAQILKNVSYLIFAFAFLFRDPLTQRTAETYRFSIAKQLWIVVITLIGILEVFTLFMVRSQQLILTVEPAEVTNRILAIIRFDLLLLFVGVGGGLLYASLAIKRITKPLQNITQVINRISKGDLSAKTNVESNDEIGDLDKAFSRTVVSLKLAMKKIYKPNQQKKSKNG